MTFLKTKTKTYEIIAIILLTFAYTPTITAEYLTCINNNKTKQQCMKTEENDCTEMAYARELCGCLYDEKPDEKIENEKIYELIGEAIRQEYQNAGISECGGDIH